MSVLHNDDGENFLMLLDGTKSVPCFEQRAWNWNGSGFALRGHEGRFKAPTQVMQIILYKPKSELDTCGKCTVAQEVPRYERRTCNRLQQAATGCNSMVCRCHVHSC